MNAIVVRALEKTYGGVLGRRGRRALAGMDLAVPAGTAFGLVGLNGAGKTTFIKCLLGVVRPTGGTVEVLGGAPEDPAVRARVGYLPERLHLPAASTPLAFLLGVASLKGLGRAEEEALRQLGRVGLAHEAGTRIRTFSKGMRQRLGFAAALLGAPDLLVLDEPTDGVDPIGRMEIRALLQEEHARGATLFLNSHLLSETERVCDRFGILAEGRLLRQGALAELAASSSRWRARFAEGAPVAALAAAGFEREGSAFLVDADGPESLAVALDRARTAGAHLVELSPALRDLESIHADAVRRDGKEAA